MKKFFGRYLYSFLLVMVIFTGCVSTQKVRPQLTFREPGSIMLADMKQGDLEKIHTVFQKTASYDTVQWTNKQTGIDYNVVPRPVIKSGEMICRSLMIETALNKEKNRFELTACRIDDSWQVQSTH